MRRSLRLIVTPGLFSGVRPPLLFSFHLRKPNSQSARAWSADVLPELFGPMKTTGLASGISTSQNRLKFRIVSLVSIAFRRPKQNGKLDRKLMILLCGGALQS